MLIHPFAALVYVFYHKLHNCSFWISVRSYSIFVYPIYAPFEVLVYGIAFDKVVLKYISRIFVIYLPAELLTIMDLVGIILLEDLFKHFRIVRFEIAHLIS